MNAVIETINSAGRTFVEFALPMFIQSSVLILILLALDVLLRRRVRAVFRYWLWMLVLLKLVLPPSLWSPVSIGTWLGETLEPPQIAVDEPLAPQPQTPPAEWQPQAKLGDGMRPDDGIAKGFGLDTPLADEVLSPLSVPVARRGESSFAPTHAPPHPDTTAGASEDSHATISWQGMILVAWAAVVLALLLLLLQRAWFVRGLVAQAQEAPARLQAALDQCRTRMGIARPISLRISPNASSPAVCGLLRPAILIPQNLAPRLQPHDLQAVLLHELTHIKRGDLWINLVQTLLQIVYFYNPLLWLANAMIRRAREQAVDEAVLVAMGETAPDYPETLLHVAKLAFHRRPALSLRLIGVVESRSALRSRIKHILARPLPKTAKLGLLGLVSVFLIAAVLLPMAKARPLTDRARSVMSLASEEARRLNHDYVGTEHILLALACQEDAVSAKVLANLGADIDTLRTEVNKFVRPGAEPVTRSTLPRMPRAEKAMQYAKEEAKSLGHDYIGTEHILLALMRERDGVAAQVFARLGITQTQIRAQVLTFVQPGRQDPEEDNDEGAGGGALVEPPEAPSSGVVAELPNGVTVEFLAYSQLTPDGLKWWTPEGKPTTIPGLYEADVEGHGTLLALRIEPEPEAGVWAWRFQPPGVSEELKPVWQVNESDIWLIPLGEGRSYANVEIAAQVRDPVVIKTASVQQGSSQDGFWVKDVTPIDADSTAFTAHGASSYSGVPMGVQVLAAIDSAGQIHAVRRIPSRSIEEQLGNPFGEPPRLQVDLPVGRFAKVVVEGYGERAGRVKFRNLSLRPGQPTEVHIEVEAEQRGPWWHPSEYDSKLEDLGRVLSEQAKARDGLYPADLAALEAYFTDTQWSWLQEHAVYLVASEPATKAETVLLAYEKTLLPAGFGTYVLFGDGDVSFQTPSELEQLGITQANRTVPRPMLSPQPVNQTKADAVPLPAVKAELPNGVTVEFLAYSHLVPRGGLFWFDPQGQETTIPGVYEADVEGLGTILALRVRPPEAHLGAQLYRGPDSQNIEKQWQLPGTDIWLLPLRDERSFANLRVLTQWTEPPAIETIPLTEENLGQLVEVNRYGIASIVDLQVVESFSADRLMNEMGQPSILGTGVATAESMGLQDVAEPPMLQFSYLREQGSFQKVVAFLDQEGRTHPVEQVKVDSTGATYQGRIWPGRLAGVRVEASAVRAADVRFRNISLTPERTTEIQIEPAASQEILWKLSYRHFVLEALTNSLRQFCERHGGRFPASLADLQSSHGPDAFRWISTHMAYVGQGKATDDDPPSVIAYDRSLLAQGQGTYVLYSDGQFEFESPVELAELGILPPNQGGTPPNSADPSSGDGVGSNAIGKPRFTVHGVVTDASGRPMEGVWVNVDCGFERPQRAGRTLTDEEGRYTLGFESAWVVANADPYGVGIQPAFVYARKDGFYETSLCHKGNLAMAGKAPGPAEQRFVAGRAGVVLVNEPYELNFVMAPAALLTGQLVDADGRPMADHDLWLFSGQMYPPHQRSISIRTGSDGTFGPYTLPCTSVRFHGALARSDEIAFTRAGNWRVTLKYRQTGPQTAQLLVEDLQGPTDRSQNSSPSAPLAWQRTDRYVPPDPNGFFPDDPQGGKQLDALFQAADKDQRSDEEILSTVRQGFRCTKQYRTLILQWIGNRYIWGKDPQNPRAVEIMYHAVPLERHYAVYFGLSVVRNKTPNVLRTLADICMEGQEVGRITWGLGDQREALLVYITPHLQDSDPARRQIAEVLAKHFKGELDFEQWQRDKQLEEAKAKFSVELPRFRETLLTGGSGARYEVLSTIQRNRLAEILEDSFVPALRAAGGDSDPKVRNEVARIAGHRWVWSARQQDPNVIELMLKLSSDSNREVRYNAVYYGLSVVRDKSESVIQRLVSLALADQEQNFYRRIVWGLKGPMRADRQLVERVLTRELEDAGTDAKRAAVHRLFKDVLGEDAPPHRELSGRVVDPNGAPVGGIDAGLWQDVGEAVPADANDARTLGPGVVLDGIGQDVEGKVFVACVRDAAATRDMQYRFVLHRKDGQVFEPQYYLRLDRAGGKVWEKFTFDMWYDHRSIDGFRLQVRRADGDQPPKIPLARDEVVAAASAKEEPPLSKQGPPGRYALSFDGRGDYLYIPDSESLRTPEQLTIELWIKPEFHEGSLENRPGWAVLAKGAYTGRGRVRHQGFALRMDRADRTSKTVTFDHCVTSLDGRGYNVAGTSQRLSQDWIHISRTFHRSEFIPAPGHPLVVGRFLIPSEDPLMGQIAEIRVWDGAKSDYLGQYKDKALTGDEPGLVACWTFEEGSGQIARDISPHANHARLGRSVSPDDADPTWLDLQAPESATTESSGRVLDPNGAPAAGAQVAWIDAERSVSITDGRLMAPRFGNRGKGPIIETDEQGNFRFEGEPNDGFSLLAAHDAGFALVGSEQFARDRVIRLQRWGRVEGQVAKGRHPLEDKIWMGGLPNSTWFEHRRDFNYETLCDSEGRFTFKWVPPGWFEVGYLTRMGDSVSSHTSRTPILVESGRTATMTLGGEGRPVIGRFVPPPDWEGPIYFGAGFRALDTARPDRPRPADYDQMTQRQQQEWLKQWHQTPEAEEYLKAVWHNPNQRHYTFCIAVDGTFRIEDVIPGKYTFTVWLEERNSHEGPAEFGGYSGTVEVPPMEEAYSDEPLDVGDLVLRLRRPLHVGDTAPTFEAKTLDGKDIRLIDYRGRFVLLNFWSPVFNPELDRLKELHATYSRTSQLQIIGLGGTDTLDEVRKYVEEHDIEWPEIYFGPDWDAELLRQLGGQMQILLIDPDGKIVATWLREEKLTDTVREALAAFTHD